MKKSYGVIRFLVALMMIAALMACASTPQQTSTGEYRRYRDHDQGKD
jgi:hypothetical protein